MALIGLITLIVSMVERSIAMSVAIDVGVEALKLADQRALGVLVFRIESADLSVQQIAEEQRRLARPLFRCRAVARPHSAARKSIRSPVRRRGCGTGRSYVLQGRAWLFLLLFRQDAAHHVGQLFRRRQLAFELRRQPRLELILRHADGIGF